MKTGKLAAGVLLCAAGMLAAPIAPSHAQTPDAFAAAAAKMYDACVANKMGAKMECACVTGFFAGNMKEDEFRIMAVISPFIDAKGDVADMKGAQNAAFAERDALGLTQARFQEVMGVFTKLGPVGDLADKSCSVVKAR